MTCILCHGTIPDCIIHSTPAPSSVYAAVTRMRHMRFQERTGDGR